MKKNQTKAEILAELEKAQKRIAELESNDPTESEERFASVFRASPSQMALTDTANGKYVEVNEAFLRTLGFRREEVVGKTASELGLFANPGQRVELLQRMVAQGTLRDEYVLVRAKTGEIRHGIFSAEYVSVNGQKLLLTVMNDITEKLQAEQRWQFALDGAGDGLWDWNPQSNKVFYSPQWKSMLGYEENEIGDSLDEWSSRVHPEDLAATMELVNAHLQGQTPIYISEHRLRCKDGSYKWILDRGKIIEWNKDNLPLRVIGTHKDITERKEAENNLRVSEERYRNLVENMSEAVIEVDEQGRYCYISPSYADLIGSPAQNDLGTSSIARVHPDDLSMLSQARESMSDETLPATVYRIKTDSGQWRWVETSGRQYQMEDGSRRVIGVTRDVTRRKLAEDKLRESEQRFSSVFHANPAAQLIVIAESGMILDCNESFCQQTGYAHADLVGRATREVGLWQDPSQLQAILQRLQSGQPVRNSEVEFRTKSGEVRTLLISFEPILLNGVRCILSSGIEITARKLAEDALAASEAQLKDLLKATPDSMIIVNAEGRIVMVNAQTEAMFGYGSDELLGETVEKLTPHETREKHKENRFKFMEQHEAITAGIDRTMFALRKNGETFPAEISLSHHKTARGEEVVLCSIRDVTRQKQFEELIAVQRDLARLTSAHLPEEMAWKACLEAVVSVSGLDCAGIYIFDEHNRQFELVSSLNLSKSFTDTVARFGEDTHSARLILSGVSHYFTETDLLGQPHHAKEGISAVAAIPLQHNRQIYGCLNIASRTRESISPHAREALETIAVEVGNVIAHLRVEAALKTSQKQLSQALTAARMGTWRYDIASGRASWSPEAASLFGIEFGQTDFGSVLARFHPEDRERAAANLQEALKNRKLQNIEYRMVDAGGNIHWVTNYGHVECDQDGSPTALVALIQDITERKAMDEKLRESEERFRSFIEQSLDGLMIADEQGMMIEWNHTLTKITGIERETALGMPMWELQFKMATPANRARIDEKQLRLALLEMLRTGTSPFLGSPNEVEIETMQGQARVIQQTSFPISTTKGYRIGAIVRDVTEKRQAEEAKREAELRYRALFNQSHDAIFILDFNGIHLDVNQRAADMLGYSMEELRGLSVRELSAEVPQSLQIIERLLKGEYVPRYERLFKKKNGEILSVEIQVELVRDIRWNPIHIQSIVRDISKRKQAEADLRESEERFRSFIEQSTDGFYLTDEAGRMIEWNKAIEKIMGLKREQALGMPIWEVQRTLTTPEQQPFTTQLKDVLEGILRNGQSSFFGKPNDAEILSLDGGRKAIQQTSFPISTTKGYRIGAVVRDISERKQMEMALQKSEERYRIISNGVTDYAFSTRVEKNGEYTMDWVAGAFESITGYTFDEFKACGGWQARLHPEDLQADELAKMELNSNRKAVSEVRIFTKSGQVAYLRVFAQPLWDEKEDRLIAIYGAVQDITERKQAEEARRESEERYRLLFETMAQGVVFQDADGVIVQANPAAEKILGLTIDQLQGRSSLDPRWHSIHEDGSPYPGEEHPAMVALRSGKMIRNEVMGVFNPAENAYHWININAVPRFSNGGEGPYQVYTTFEDFTERKQAEKALRKSEANYRLVAENISDVIWIMDTAEIRYRFVSPSVTQLLGYSVEEVLTHDAFSSLPQTSLDYIAKAWSVRLDDFHQGATKVYTDELEYLRKDGELIWVEVTTRYLLNPETGHVEIYGVTRDITERKHADEKLRESEQKYRDLINGMNDTIWVIDNDMSILDVNNAASAILGYTREELLAMKVPEIDASLADVQIQNLVDTLPVDKAQVFETSHQTKDGRKIPVEVSSSLVTYAGRTVIMSIARDITERKRAEEELHLVEKRYRALVEYAPDGVVLIDVNGKFKYASPSVERIFGYTQEDLPFCDSLAMTHPEDMPIVLPELAKIIEEPSLTPTLQYRFKHKNGEWRWIESTFSNLLATPNVEAIIINFRDIHERKLAEEELNKSQELLKEAQRIGRIGHMEWNGRDAPLICSDEIYNILDLPQGRIITQNVIAEMMSPGEAERIHKLDILAIQSRDNMDYEYCIQRNDGSECWIHQMGNVTYDENGAPTRMMAIVQDVTERRQAENTLRESQSRLEMGLKGANAAMWDWNVKTGETVFNERWAEIIGYTLKELEPTSIQTWADLCHPDDLKISDLALEKHFARETEFYESEARMKHKNGSWVWVIDRGRVMEWDAEGKPVRMFGTHLDITERKRNEQTTQAILRLSNLSNETRDMDTLMRSMLDEAEALTNSAVGFFHFVDDDQNTIKLQAWSTNTLANLCTAEGKGQHYPVESAGVWADAIRDGEPRIYNDYPSLSHRRGLPEGHAPIKRMATLPIKRNNLVVAALGVGNKPQDYDDSDLDALKRLAEAMFDIIMRRRAEDALRQNEERFRTVADFTYDMEYWLDENQTLLYISPSCQRITGYPREAFIENQSLLKDIIHPDDRARFERHRTDEFDSLASCSLDFRILTADGATRWINHTCQSVRAEDGSARGRRVSHRDITERKEADQKLREQMEDMALVNALNDAANRGESLGRITEILSQETRQIFHCKNAGIYLLSPDGQNLILQQNTIPEPMKKGIEKIIGRPIPQVHIPIKPGNYFTEILNADKGRVTSGPEVLQKWIKEFADTPFLPEAVRPAVKALAPQIFKFIGIRSVITIPLKSAEKTLGAMEVSSAELLSEQTLERLQNVRSALTEIIKRKQVEQELMTSEEKYRGLMESLNNAISTVAHDGTFLFLNDMAAENLGATPSELIGKKVQDVFPAPFGARQLEAVQGVFHANRELVIETPSFIKDGLRWFRVAFQPLHDESGKVAEVLVNVTDIHDLKTAQQDLQELNRTLEERVKQRTAEVQDLYDNAPAGYHSLDENGCFLQVNQTELDWLGYTREEVIGRPETDFITEASAQIFHQTFPLLKTRGWTHDQEVEFVRKDGSTFPTMINAVAILDENGRFIASRTTLTDITRRKEAEDELKRNVNFTNALLNAIPTPVFYTDEQGRYQGCNRAFSEIMGKTPEEIQGKTVQELWPGEETERYREMDLTLLQTRERQVFESSINDKNNNTVPVIFIKDVYYDEFGEVAGLVAAFIDITARKQAEETMRLANLELERSLRLKDEFLANMSHELRTPLNAVLGISESLLEQFAGPLNAKQQKYTQTIHESGKHLLELINDVLDLAKINAGRMELDLIKVGIPAMAQSCMRMIKELAQKKNQVVSLQIAPDVDLVWADERRLKQMVVNLLSNAIKFTPDGGRLGLEIEGDSQNKILTLTVWDTGIGIADKDLRLLFQPFVQLDGSLTRGAQGTGLGLALVSQMARLHGGGVTVESQPGQGSRFTISIPWVVSGRTGPLGVRPAPKLQEEAPVHDQTILLVEDTEAVTMVIQDYLEGHGYKVNTAKNGIEGVAKARETNPDLILMDVMMPEMDGLEATKRIRSEPGLGAVPIIALTALAMTGDRERCLAAGMNDYLSKPVKLNELLEVVNLYVKANRLFPRTDTENGGK